jgi:ribosomal protein S18 acetylase RimI-like enzyme
MRLSLRPAVEADFAFCESLTRSNMASYHSARGAGWDPQRFVDNWALFENSMILADGEVVGLLRLLVVDGALEIRDLQLLPGQRGRGIGTWAVNYVVVEAVRRGIELLRLRVFEENPALQLYARLGFGVEAIDESGKAHMSRALPAGYGT